MIEVLTRNAGLKVLALFLAFGLWVLVAGEQESVRVFSVPLDYRTPRDRVLSGQAPATVQVRVRGSESILRAVTSEDLSIPVDLSSAAATGEKTVMSLRPGSVQGIPAGAAVDTVTPDRLVLTVEPVVSRTVPVSPRFEGAPAEGYRLVEFLSDPAQVTIEGPRSDVERVPVVYTEPISLHGRQGESFVSTAPSVGNPKIHVLGTRKITVRLRIDRDGTSR